MDDIRAVQISFMNYTFISSLFRKLPTDPNDDRWNELTTLKIVLLPEPLVFVVNQSEGEAEFFDMTCFRKEFDGEINTIEFSPITRK